MKDFFSRRFWPSGALLALFVGLLSLNYLASRGPRFEVVPYSQLVKAVDEGRVKKVEIRTNEVLAELEESEDETAPTRIAVERLPAIDETELLGELKDGDIEFTGRIDRTSPLTAFFWGWLLPIGVIFAIYYFIARRLMNRGNGAGPLSLGRNKAKIYDESQSVGVTFSDVAGIDESVAEVRELVDFLKHPKKYEDIGAQIPKGVLFVGPPGTGKTLLARAVAGEAKVPFFSLSGSDFVEMFVGVGAARVRDLFEQARKKSPAIIFIDEIDAIGKSRGGVAAMGTHDEREQTLNQLLSEMDGFGARSGVVIIAATNRPEVLDPALVRAGRFDRQVLVDRPDVGGRRAILEVHAKRIKLSEDIDLGVTARRTAGMVGADLAKVVNEAALAAARRGSTVVEHRDFEEAVDRIQLGLKKSGRAMNEAEKRRVAFHESGHALVAMSVEHADPVHRVSVIPRSIGALGVTLQLPTEERYLMLKRELLDRICVMLGGRAAEELALGEVSTGAQNDLERATETARQMICRFGMSDALGPQTFGRPMGARFLDSPVQLGDERNFSEATAQQIDAEVRRIIDGQHERAMTILSARSEVMSTMVERLLIEETLDEAALNDLAAWARAAA